MQHNTIAALLRFNQPAEGLSFLLVYCSLHRGFYSFFWFRRLAARQSLHSSADDRASDREGERPKRPILNNNFVLLFLSFRFFTLERPKKKRKRLVTLETQAERIGSVRVSCRISSAADESDEAAWKENREASKERKVKENK